MNDQKTRFYLADQYLKDRNNQKKGVILLQQLAAEGYSDAQVSLGHLHSLNILNHDPIKALNYFLDAAKQKNPYAEHNLGIAYLNGNGVTRSLKRAEEWFTKAAKQNHVPSIQALEYLNAHKAKIQEKASNGDAEGLYKLGMFHLEGFGVQKSDNSAFLCFARASELGYTPAAIEFAYMIHTGRGYAEDPVEDPEEETNTRLETKSGSETKTKTEAEKRKEEETKRFKDAHSHYQNIIKNSPTCAKAKRLYAKLWLEEYATNPAETVTHINWQPVTTFLYEALVEGDLEAFYYLHKYQIYRYGEIMKLAHNCPHLACLSHAREENIHLMIYERGAAQGIAVFQHEMGQLCESGEYGPFDNATRHQKATEYYRVAAEQGHLPSQLALKRLCQPAITQPQGKFGPIAPPSSNHETKNEMNGKAKHQTPRFSNLVTKQPDPKQPVQGVSPTTSTLPYMELRHSLSQSPFKQVQSRKPVQTTEPVRSNAKVQT